MIGSILLVLTLTGLYMYSECKKEKEEYHDRENIEQKDEKTSDTIGNV